MPNNDYSSKAMRGILRPFEVISIGSGENLKIAVHTGILFSLMNGQQLGTTNFKSTSQPQNILGDTLDDAKFLSGVEKDEYIYIYMEHANSTNPDLYLEHGDSQAIDELNRVKKRVIILAKIIEEGSAGTPVEIEYRYNSELQYIALFYPAFTPIVWAKLPTGEEEEVQEYYCVFMPGAVHLSHTGDVTAIPKVAKIVGTGPDGKVEEDMMNFPIMNVAAREEWFLDFSIDPDWEFEDEPRFSTKPRTDGDAYTIGRNPCDENSGLSGECEEQTGRYGLKVLVFEQTGEGITPKIYWRSDYTIHKNPRCHCCECSDSGGGGGSDKSTAIVPAPWLPTRYAALFTAEMPEVRFDDIVEVNMSKREELIQIDRRFIHVCENGTIDVCSVSGDSGFAYAEVIKDKIKVKSSFFSRPKRVIIRLTGIRKGFKGFRFEPRTALQFQKNEEFLNSAYPKDEGTIKELMKNANT